MAGQSKLSFGFKPAQNLASKKRAADEISGENSASKKKVEVPEKSASKSPVKTSGFLAVPGSTEKEGSKLGGKRLKRAIEDSDSEKAKSPAKEEAKKPAESERSEQ